MAHIKKREKARDEPRFRVTDLLIYCCIFLSILPFTRARHLLPVGGLLTQNTNTRSALLSLTPCSHSLTPLLFFPYPSPPPSPNTIKPNQQQQQKKTTLYDTYNAATAAGRAAAAAG